jgi:SAM-dependent methyltransferase
MSISHDYLPSETPNGALKRCAFIADLLRENRPKNVLDVGCGTGALLTTLLAARFPDTQFTGVDSDATTIGFAQTSNTHANLEFVVTDELPEYRRFDMIIASEVIEHVEEPIAFLIELRRHLRPNGVLVLTMPNGYGPYELTAIIESLLHVSGILPALYWISDRLRRRDSRQIGFADTLAHSPHINWFSHRRIRSVMCASGFEIERYVPRVFLCGLGLQQLLRTEQLRRWNARIADRLPAMLNSGWMFVASKETARRLQPMPYRRTSYEMLRRQLSEWRWSRV